MRDFDLKNILGLLVFALCVLGLNSTDIFAETTTENVSA